MHEFEEIINVLEEFNKDRDWDQFHNAKDLAIALNIESSELLEQFLWKSPNEASAEKVKNELADVFAYAFLLASKLKLNPKDIVLEKIKKNALKYPVEKAKGSAKKYTDLLD